MKVHHKLEASAYLLSLINPEVETIRLIHDLASNFFFLLSFLPDKIWTCSLCNLFTHILFLVPELIADKNAQRRRGNVISAS